MNNLTIKDIKRINKKKGRFFFSDETMRFFNSQVYDRVYKKDKDTYFFITSEQREEHTERLFTIREFNSETGIVNTCREFQKYKTLSEARKAIKALGVEVQK